MTSGRIQGVCDTPLHRLYSLARNAQHVQFATDVLNAVSEETARAQGFASQRAVLATAAADELDCFQPDKGYMDTPEIVSTDRRRDNTFLFYKQLAQAYSRRAQP